MIRIGVIAALAALCAASAYAQVQVIEPVVPRGVPEQRVEPAGELPPPAPLAPPPQTIAPRPVQLVTNARRVGRDADARHCLTLASNRQVHRCAEPYRSRASRAATRKTSMRRAPAAQAPIEITKPVDAVKPGAPRPEDAAKAADLVKPMDVTRPGAVPRPIDSSAAAPKPGTPAAPAATPSPPPEAKLPAPLMKPSESKVPR